VCCCDYTLCDRERQPRITVDTLASEEQYKQGTQRSTSQEQEVVRADARQGEEECVLQKGPKVLRPNHQVVAFASLRKSQE